MSNVLYISNPCYLSIKDKNIIVSTEKDGATRVPIGDVSVVVLENNYSSMSSAFMSHLAEKNIVLFTCDSSFMPNGIFLPFHQHSRYTEVSNLQLEWSEPFKKSIWKKIVINKVENQISLLKDYEFNTFEMTPYLSKIKSGDSTNVEAIVASYYWNIIFSNTLYYYTRNMDDIRNSALNYGYSIVRSAVARGLVASGFTPFFGLHHKNKLNSFNLVDDMMEVFRCVVDREVYVMFEEEGLADEVLTKEIKRRLISPLEATFIIDNKKYSMLSAITTYVDSLKRATKLKNSDLLVKVKLDG
jgi:CRISPR-associated protein Cas1